MKLYEINAELEQALEQLDFDWETGEIGENYDDELFQRVQKLAIERQELLQYLAKVALNYKAEAAAIKEEEARLKKRRDVLDNKYESLVNVLDRECAGQKTDLGVATVKYRKSVSTEIGDEKKCLEWLQAKGYDNAWSIPKPEAKIDKNELKKIHKTEAEIPGVDFIEKNSCSLG